MTVMQTAEHKMQSAVEVLEQELKTIRTGMANAAILEHVTFEYYGSPMPINQMAGIKVVEGRQLMITPYDKGTLKDIERAIAMSDIGLVPQNDGDCIRLNVPALTEERRKEFVKDASKMGENAKIAIRNVRRDANDTIKKDKELTEDESKDLQDKIQKLTDKFVKLVEQAVDAKYKEILKV